MLIIVVYVHVKPESVTAFKNATLENARNSVREPGIARFDVIQQADDPSRFILLEVYRDEPATVAHKGTPHYLKWRDTVADMMAEPRQGVRYTNLFPADAQW